MVAIKYEVNGRQVSWEQFKDDLLSEIMVRFGEEVQATLATCVCPVHNEHPSVTIKSTSTSSITCEVAGCCDVLKELAEKKLEEIE